MERKVVSDTGSLITLEKIQNGYDFIRLLYDTIIIPQKVLEELTCHYDSAVEYLKKYNIEDFLVVHEVESILDFQKSLEDGEIHAISLAIQLKLGLLIEEDDGREAAKKAGINITGIAGLVRKAWKLKIISQDEAQNKYKELFDKRRLDQDTYTNLIKKLS